MIRNILKTALPNRIVQIMRDLGRVQSGARATYLRLLWQRRRGRRAAADSLTRHSKVVMICHGNILRSAFAEALLREAVLTHRAPGLLVSSAGLHAVPGKSADPRGVVVAKEWGVDLTAHRATRLSAEAVAAADLILVMDLLNLAELVWAYPGAADKVALLGEFDPVWTNDPVISDPYSGDLEEVRVSYGRVVAAVEGLVAAPTGF
jgi:protein-tyrosine-phosphatase